VRGIFVVLLFCTFDNLFGLTGSGFMAMSTDGVAIIYRIKFMKYFKIPFTAVVSMVALSITARADVDAQKVLDALSGQFANMGMSVKAAGAELQGSNVILKDVVFTPAAVSPDVKPANVGDLMLENVTENGDGFIVGQLTAPAKTIENADGSLKFGGATVKNMRIAGPSTTDPIARAVFYDSIEVAPLSFSTGGAEVFRMDGATVKLSPYTAGQPMQMDMNFNGIYGNLSTVPDPQAKQAIADLGLTEIKGKITAKGSWNPADGRFALTEESFDFENIGKLNFTVDLSGYTADFVKASQDLVKQSAGKSDPAAGMAMMGLMQQLSMNSVSLRFDDASITGRILDYAAKQQGMPKETLLAQIKGMVPLMAMQLQDVDFTTSVTAAVTSFLDNPKSIEIKAAPAASTPFSAIMATGMTQPQALIKQLNVTLTANQ
jgi:hypothetical protein